MRDKTAAGLRLVHGSRLFYAPWANRAKPRVRAPQLFSRMPHPRFLRDTENVIPQRGAASQSRKVSIFPAATLQAPYVHFALGESVIGHSAGAPALYPDLSWEIVMQSLFSDAQPDLAGLCVDPGYGALRGSSQLSYHISPHPRRRPLRHGEKRTSRSSCFASPYPLAESPKSRAAPNGIACKIALGMWRREAGIAEWRPDGRSGHSVQDLEICRRHLLLLSSLHFRRDTGS
jgi:hypothetical protein